MDVKDFPEFIARFYRDEVEPHELDQFHIIDNKIGSGLRSLNEEDDNRPRYLAFAPSSEDIVEITSEEWLDDFDLALERVLGLVVNGQSVVIYVEDITDDQVKILDAAYGCLLENFTDDELVKHGVCPFGMISVSMESRDLIDIEEYVNSVIEDLGNLEDMFKYHIYMPSGSVIDNCMFQASPILYLEAFYDAGDEIVSTQSHVNYSMRLDGLMSFARLAKLCGGNSALERCEKYGIITGNKLAYAERIEAIFKLWYGLKDLLNGEEFGRFKILFNENI